MSDLTPKEQEHVRVALRFIHARCGTWAHAAKALRANRLTLMRVAAGSVVSASTAVRVARLAQVNVDDVLGGEVSAARNLPALRKA